MKRKKKLLNNNINNCTCNLISDQCTRAQSVPNCSDEGEDAGGGWDSRLISQVSGLLAHGLGAKIRRVSGQALGTGDRRSTITCPGKIIQTVQKFN